MIITEALIAACTRIIQLPYTILLYIHVMLSTIRAMKNKMYAVQKNLCTSIQMSYLEDKRSLKICTMKIIKKTFYFFLFIIASHPLNNRSYICKSIRNTNLTKTNNSSVKGSVIVIYIVSSQDLLHTISKKHRFVT